MSNLEDRPDDWTLADTVGAIVDAGLCMGVKEQRTPKNRIEWMPYFRWRDESRSKEPVPPNIVAAAKRFKGDLVMLLRGMVSAKLEGLACGKCHPELMPKDRFEALETCKYRYCVHHANCEDEHDGHYGAAPHYKVKK